MNFLWDKNTVEWKARSRSLVRHVSKILLQGVAKVTKTKILQKRKPSQKVTMSKLGDVLSKLM